MFAEKLQVEIAERRRLFEDGVSLMTVATTYLIEKLEKPFQAN